MPYDVENLHSCIESFSQHLLNSPMPKFVSKRLKRHSCELFVILKTDGETSLTQTCSDFTILRLFLNKVLQSIAYTSNRCTETQLNQCKVRLQPMDTKRRLSPNSSNSVSVLIILSTSLWYL